MNRHGAAKMAAVRKRPDIFEVMEAAEEDEKEIRPIRGVHKDCHYDDMMADFYACITEEKTILYNYKHKYCVQKKLDVICAFDKI